MPPTEWDSLSHCVAMFAAAALVEGAQPPSLLLIGPPATGKSETVRRFAQWPKVVGASDFTVDGLRDLLTTNSGLRLIALDEFQRIFSHTKDAVQNVTGLLLSLLSGNASRELVGPKGKGTRVNLEGRRIGMLTALPIDVLMSRGNDMTGTGLLSRYSTLSVMRSESEAARVKHNIIHEVLDDLLPYPIPRKMPRHVVRVDRAKGMAEELERFAVEAFGNGDDRRYKMLTVLVRAVALLNGRVVATAKDVGQLRQFSDFLTSIDFSGAISPKWVAPLTKLPTWAQ